MNNLQAGRWRSPIDASLATKNVRHFSSLQATENALYWLERRPEENARTTLNSNQISYTQEDSLLPIGGYSIGSRVHEYGGGAWIKIDDGYAFVNKSDQQIYIAKLTDNDSPQIIPITNSPALRFGGLSWHSQRQFIVCIAEAHHIHQSEPSNFLVAVDAKNGAIHPLHTGEDFYASPSISPDGSQLTWTSWNHPYMPWDHSKLHVATFTDQQMQITDIQTIASNQDHSIFQPTWSPSGKLYFASDRTGFWNLYQYNFNDNSAHILHEENADYGLPLWQLDAKTYTFLTEDIIACISFKLGNTRLQCLTLTTSSQNIDKINSIYDLPFPAKNISDIAANSKTLYILTSSPNQQGQILSTELDHDTLSQQPVFAGFSVLAEQAKDQPPNDYLTSNDPFCIELQNRTIYGHFYPPKNPEYEHNIDSPPCLILVHSGPTSCASLSFNPRIQYYTSRGWAVIDINYSGSTGFGRAYRTSLNHEWGVRDVEDSVATVQYFLKNKRIHPNKLAIRGSSSGGFTALNVLIKYPKLFQAAAIHYGVSDLRKLHEETHKFESQYLTSLIGDWHTDQQRYIDRSPIDNAQHIITPTIFFQGTKDYVVPLSQTASIKDMLESNNTPTQLHIFEGEGHGFRQKEHVEDALTKEYTFFCEHLSI